MACKLIIHEIRNSKQTLSFLSRKQKYIHKHKYYRLHKCTWVDPRCGTFSVIRRKYDYESKYIRRIWIKDVSTHWYRFLFQSNKTQIKYKKKQWHKTKVKTGKLSEFPTKNPYGENLPLSRNDKSKVLEL